MSIIKQQLKSRVFCFGHTDYFACQKTFDSVAITLISAASSSREPSPRETNAWSSLLLLTNSSGRQRSFYVRRNTCDTCHTCRASQHMWCKPIVYQIYRSHRKVCCTIGRQSLCYHVCLRACRRKEPLVQYYSSTYSTCNQAVCRTTTAESIAFFNAANSLRTTKVSDFVDHSKTYTLHIHRRTQSKYHEYHEHHEITLTLQAIILIPQLR